MVVCTECSPKSKGNSHDNDKRQNDYKKHTSESHDSADFLNDIGEFYCPRLVRCGYENRAAPELRYTRDSLKSRDNLLRMTLLSC